MSKSRSREEEMEQEEEILSFLEERAQDLRNNHRVRRGRTSANIAARNQLFAEELESIFKKHPFPAPKKYVAKKKAQGGPRILNLMLSDLHYGADLNEAETSHRFGPIEEARRTAAVVLQAAEYKRQYRENTELYVHLLGDIIQGKLHDPEDAAPLTEQTERAWWNLSQALAFLCQEFKKVTVFCSPGNHGRRKDRHPGRAVNQKWDSVEQIIYTGLQLGSRHIKNLEIKTFKTPYYTYEAFGLRGFMTHGDTVLMPGYPGKSINVGSIRHQVNEINLKEHCQLYGVGHVHTASNTRLPNKVVFLTNGCLLPSDEFAQSVGIFDTTCCQQIWESVPGHIFGDRRDAIVDEETDKDASLDKIIKPHWSAQSGLRNSSEFP